MATGRIPINGTAAIQSTIVDAKGDLIAATGADAVSRLAVGANGTTLVADSSEATGLRWAAPAGASFIGVQATKSTDQSCAASTNTQITWDTHAFDTDGFHSTLTNTQRLTVPAGLGGYYKVYFAMQWASSATVARRIVGVYKNGDANTGTQLNNFETSSINFPSCAMSFTVNLSAADWIEIDAIQLTAGALNFRQSLAIFGMEKIG